MSRLTSTQVRHLLLLPLSDGKVWHIENLRKWIEENFPPSEEDNQPYADRPNERAWYATLDNALAPSRTTSLCSTDEAQSLGDGLYRITDLGMQEADKVRNYFRERKPRA